MSLCQFAPDIWTAEGPVISFHSFAYSTRMAVVKLSSGGLFIWSPVALSIDLKRAIDKVGQPCCLVAPNKLHHLFLCDWKIAYPDAQVYAPPDLKNKLKHLSFTELIDEPAPDWAADIDQVIFRGSMFLTEVVFFHRASQTAIFADLLQNFPREWFQGWRGVIARLGGIVEPHPGAPRDLRTSFLNRRAARLALGKILAWPIEQVIIAHGHLAMTEGKEFVRRGFDWLTVTKDVSLSDENH